MLQPSRRTWIRALCLLVLTLPGLGPLGPAGAESKETEAGINPSNVYSVWININKAILATAPDISDDPEWLAGLAAMQPAEFSGKEPRHVLAEVRRFSAEVNKMRAHAGFSPVRLPEDRQKILPSLVFLSSGRVLAGLLDHFNCMSQTGFPVAEYFGRKQFYDKTPSDVFGEVDLAARRLVLLQATLPNNHTRNPKCSAP